MHGRIRCGSTNSAMDKPLILSLDAHGVPHRWISWQQACFYYAKNLVAWTLGDETFTYYGGISRLTGERSSITAHSIIAIKGKALAAKGFNQAPPLNNREPIRRDRHVCAHSGRPRRPRAVPARPSRVRLLRRRVQLFPPRARPHPAAVAGRPRLLDERGDRLP